MIQAIFFDIDGTLISPANNQYTQSTKKALEELRKKGIYLFVATGRHLLEIEEEHLLDGLVSDGYITLNGQYCFNDEKVIYENPINREDVKNVIRQIEAVPYPCMFVERDKMYINMVDEKVIEAQKAIHTAIPPVMDISRALENRIYQMIPYVDAEQAKTTPLSVLNHSKATRWNEFAIDIIPEDGSKREGIKSFLDFYGIPLENTMAFGDGSNDLEMIEYVAVGVVMGNAREIIKEAADYVTEDVDQDGIVNALKHFRLL